MATPSQLQQLQSRRDRALAQGRKAEIYRWQGRDSTGHGIVVDEFGGEYRGVINGNGAAGVGDPACFEPGVGAQPGAIILPRVPLPQVPQVTVDRSVPFIVYGRPNGSQTDIRIQSAGFDRLLFSVDRYILEPQCFKDDESIPLTGGVFDLSETGTLTGDNVGIIRQRQAGYNVSVQLEASGTITTPPSASNNGDWQISVSGLAQFAVNQSNPSESVSQSFSRGIGGGASLQYRLGVFGGTTATFTVQATLTPLETLDPIQGQHLSTDGTFFYVSIARQLRLEWNEVLGIIIEVPSVIEYLKIKKDGRLVSRQTFTSPDELDIPARDPLGIILSNVGYQYPLLYFSSLEPEPFTDNCTQAYSFQNAGTEIEGEDFSYTGRSVKTLYRNKLYTPAYELAIPPLEPDSPIRQFDTAVVDGNCEGSNITEIGTFNFRLEEGDRIYSFAYLP